MKMGKVGIQCCAFGCSKRIKNVKGNDNTSQSYSEGPDDEEFRLKRTF